MLSNCFQYEMSWDVKNQQNINNNVFYTQSIWG